MLRRVAKPASRVHSLVLDLNVVSDEQALARHAAMARRSGGRLLINPTHLEEVWKDDSTWRASLVTHFADLRKHGDVVAVTRGTNDILVQELSDRIPARQLISGHYTDLLVNALRYVRSSKDLDRWLGPDAEAVRELAKRHDILNADEQKAVQLANAQLMRDEVIVRAVRESVKQAGQAYVNEGIAKAATLLLAKNQHLAGMAREGFSRFVAGSIYFKLIAAELHLSFQQAYEGLSSDARADKLLNHHFDQYMIAFGAAAGGVASKDRKLVARLKAVLDSTALAVKYVSSHWDEVWNAMQQPRHGASVVEARRASENEWKQAKAKAGLSPGTA